MSLEREIAVMIINALNLEDISVDDDIDTESVVLGGDFCLYSIDEQYRERNDVSS